MAEGLIAGTGLTYLQVYDQRPAPDGILCGCPHVHALTDEAYFVIAGEGAVDLHDLECGFRTVPLKKGDYISYPPLTMHRTVNQGGLEILAMMGNAGLPERGDARIYFGPEIDMDPEAYAHNRALSQTGLEGALDRRDQSVRGYQHLLSLWDQDRDAYERELVRFFELHKEAMTARRDEFADVVSDGPDRFGNILRARLAGQKPEVPEDPVRHLEADVAEVRHGMCGVLRQLEP